MPYSPNIPQSGDDPSASQALILDNFQTLNNQYGVNGDHVEWTAVSGNGKHKKVTWLDQTASPPAPPGANSIVAYGITNSGVTMPYYKRDTVATQFPFSPIKAYAIVQVTNPTAGSSILDGFNLNLTSVTLTPNAFVQIRLNLINAMRTSIYGVLVAFSAPYNSNSQPITRYQITDASNFIVTFNAITSSPSFPINFTIIALEP